MATNLDVDATLLERAKKLGGHRTKRAAVTAALEAYVARFERRKVKALFGTVDYDADYHHKALRGRSTE